MRSAIVAFTVLCAFALQAVAAEPAEQGWQSIPLVKDGKISDEWVQIGFGKFDVVDGKNIRTAPDAQGLGLLVYKAQKTLDTLRAIEAAR